MGYPCPAVRDSTSPAWAPSYPILRPTQESCAAVSVPGPFVSSSAPKSLTIRSRVNGFFRVWVTLACGGCRAECRPPGGGSW
jgi:hypothetical protein